MNGTEFKRNLWKCSECINKYLICSVESPQTFSIYIGNNAENCLYETLTTRKLCVEQIFVHYISDLWGITNQSESLTWFIFHFQSWIGLTQLFSLLVLSVTWVHWTHRIIDEVTWLFTSWLHQHIHLHSHRQFEKVKCEPEITYMDSVSKRFKVGCFKNGDVIKKSASSVQRWGNRRCVTHLWSTCG